MYVALERRRALVETARRVYPGANVEAPHCSLSRPFTLWIHEIDAFVARLKLELGPCRPFPLRVLEDRVECVPLTRRVPPRSASLHNHDDWRTFKALRIEPSAGLANLVAAVDAALEAFNQPKYFADPVFHVRISQTQPQNTLPQVTVHVEPAADSSIAKRSKIASPSSSSSYSSGDDDNLFFEVDAVVCKCGHRYFRFAL